MKCFAKLCEQLEVLPIHPMLQTLEVEMITMACNNRLNSLTIEPNANGVAGNLMKKQQRDTSLSASKSTKLIR